MTQDWQEEHAKHEAERKKLASGEPSAVEAPPVDNVHVAEGAEPFAVEDIQPQQETTHDEVKEETDLFEEEIGDEEADQSEEKGEVVQDE